MPAWLCLSSSLRSKAFSRSSARRRFSGRLLTSPCQSLRSSPFSQPTPRRQISCAGPLNSESVSRAVSGLPGQGDEPGVYHSAYRNHSRRERQNLRIRTENEHEKVSEWYCHSCLIGRRHARPGSGRERQGEEISGRDRESRTISHDDHSE